MHGANIGGFDFTIRSPFRRLGVYPLGEDIPQYPASTIFLVLAQALPLLQAHQPPRLLQALPLLQELPLLQALPSPPVLEVGMIDCSQST